MQANCCAMIGTKKGRRQMSTSILTITDKAKEKMLTILNEQGSDAEGIRVAVIGGGCSGLSYKIDFSKMKENDNILDLQSFRLFIDPKSSIYLSGVMIDFSDGLNGKGFVFKNPNATNTCGCGESFSL
jgi:iron-sulfur cluster assembly protein